MSNRQQRRDRHRAGQMSAQRPVVELSREAWAWFVVNELEGVELMHVIEGVAADTDVVPAVRAFAAAHDAPPEVLAGIGWPQP